MHPLESLQTWTTVALALKLLIARQECAPVESASLTATAPRLLPSLMGVLALSTPSAPAASA